MKKKAVIWLFCLIQVVTLCAMPIKNTQAAQTKAAKKIISVVYDDSGSMWDANDSWAAANYAMQAFAGLLNADDEMYLTYMSEFERGAKELDITNPQTAVNNIMGKPGNQGGTPLRSIEVAAEKLISINETDENTQFWLIILTDGKDMQLNKAKSNSLQSCLDSYAGKKMSNGSTLQIYYMGIGNAMSVSPDPGQGFNSVMPGNDIVPALSDIANKVSGRMKFANSEINQVDGKTVKLYSEIPLYSIAVFSQNSKAQVTEAKGDGAFVIDRNVSLESPNSTLYGNAAMITNGSNVIQPGEYTLTFSEDISLEDTVFMYQIAIEMKPVLTKNGVELDDVNDVAIGDVIDIELIPTNPETGDAIDESKLPAGITWGIKYSIDGTEMKSSKSRTLTGVQADEGVNKITCTMQIPEYAPMIQNITLQPVIPVVYGISAVPSADDVYNRNELGLDKCLGTPDRFYITADGVPLGKEEVEKLNLSELGLEVIDVQVDDSMLKGFLDTFGSTQIDVKIKLQDDGSFVAYPGKSLVPPFMLQAGDYTVTLAFESDNSCTATGTFYINPRLVDWFALIPIIFFLCILAYICYILFVKYKFTGERMKIDVYKAFGGDGEGKLMTTQCEEIVLHKFTLSTFLPTRASTKVVPGLGFKVIAAPGGVYFKVSSLKAFQKAGPSGCNPETNYDGLVSSLKDTSDIIASAAATEIVLGATPYYIKQGRRVYKITVVN